MVAKTIFTSLHDPFIKLYFFFLKWVLPKICRTNQYFQSSKVVIADVHEEMVALLQELLSSYMKKNYILSTKLSKINCLDKSQFLPKSQIYLGVHVAMEFQNQKALFAERQDCVDYYLSRCQEFLIQACVEIKKRYDFKNPVLEQKRSSNLLWL